MIDNLKHLNNAIYVNLLDRIYGLGVESISLSGYGLKKPN